MDKLMVKILSRENMIQASKKVKSNKGASGRDGIGVDEIDDYLREHWKNSKESILRRKHIL